MKKLLAFLLLTASCFGQILRPVTVDFNSPSAPQLTAYQGNLQGWTVRLTNDTDSVALTNRTPFFFVQQNQNSSNYFEAVCTVIDAANGTYKAVLAPTNCNIYGNFLYGAGFCENSNTNVTTASHGSIQFIRDGYKNSAWPTNTLAPIDCSKYTFLYPPWSATYQSTNTTFGLAWVDLNYSSLSQLVYHAGVSGGGGWINGPYVRTVNGSTGDVAVASVAAVATAQGRADDAYQLAASLTNSSGGSITGSYVSGITLGGGAALTGTVALGTAALLDSNNVAQLNTINGVHNFTIKASDSISDDLYGGYINIPYLPAPGLGIYAHGYVTIGPALNIVTDGSLQGDPAFTINGVEVSTANIANIGLTASNALAMATTNSTTIATFGNIVTHNTNEFATWGATNALISTGAFWNAMTAYTATTNLGSAAFAGSNQFVRSVTVNGSTSNVNAGGNVNLGTISGGASSGTNGTTSAWTNGAGVVTASINPATGNYIGGTFNGVTVTQAQTWCAGFCYITGGTFILASNAVNSATYSVLTPLPAYATNIINVSGNIAFTRSNLVGAAISNLCVEVYRENIGGSGPDGLCLIPLQSSDYAGTGSGYDYYRFSRPLTNKTFATPGNYNFTFGYAQVFLRNLGYAGPVSNLLGCATVEVSK